MLSHARKIVVGLGLLLSYFPLTGAITYEAPKIEGLFDGDLYQRKANSVTLEKSARIEGTWYVPGSPKLGLRGGTLQSGSIVEGEGSSEPSGYEIRLEDDSFVERIVNRTFLEANDLPEVVPVVPSTGTRKVDIKKPTDTIGDASTIEELHLHLGRGEEGKIIVSLPGGSYDKIAVHDGSTLVLGTAGATEPEIYNIKRLDINNDGRVNVVGPVIVRFTEDLDLDTHFGNNQHPEWLRLETNADEIEIRSKGQLYAVVISPNTKVKIDGVLEGALYAKKIELKSHGIYRERASIYLPSNQAPEAIPGTFTVLEDAELTANLQGSDPDGDALTFSLVSSPEYGQLTLAENGQFTYEPNEDFFGEDVFDFQVSDGVETSGPASVSITIDPVNDEPVAGDQSFDLTEDSSLYESLAASDGDGDPLVYRILTLPSGGALLMGSSLRINAEDLPVTLPDSNFTYLPDSNFNGNDSFTYRANDGAQDSNVATVSLSVAAVNDAPNAFGADFQMEQGATLSGNLSGNDVEGDAITFGLVDAPSNGSAVVNPDGSFSYTPEPAFTGEVSFTYQVNDGSLDSTVATVTVEVMLVADVSLSIMHPADGMTVENVRPALMAPFAANFDIRESDFRVYLDGIDYSADVLIEGDKAAFLPFFDFSEGSHTYRIDLVIDDTVLSSATTTFTIESVLPDPTDTQFSGRVHSLEGVPIEGVVIYSGVQSATTDANGHFGFVDLPYGNNLFEFDPSNAADGKLYTPVNLSFEVRPGRKTVWERPVFLAEYDPADGVNVVSNSPTDQVIENPNLPGVRVVIPAGTEIDFPDGSTSGVVTIVDIPVALSPNCLGAGIRLPRLISLQPENTRLSQPAQLIFPNDLDLPEGTSFDLMSLNIETGIFGQVGRASVVNNEVVTDAGSGLRTFDWHAPEPEPPHLDNVDTESNDKEHADQEVVCSTMVMRTGELMEDHSIPSYYSLGASRAIGLHYSSLIAAPEILTNAELSIPQVPLIPEPDALWLVTSTPVGSEQSFFAPSDLSEGNAFSAARSMDASDLSTGEYELTTRVTGLFTLVNGTTGALNSRSQKTTVGIFNGRDLYPAFGLGWSVSNVSRLLFDGDGDVSILSGRGRVTRFTEGAVASEFEDEEVSIDNLGFERGLIGTGLSGNDGFSDDPRVIVSSLGFIQPTEGKQMLLLQNTDEIGVELNGPLAISIPLHRKPFGASRLIFDLDLLADKLIENGFEAVAVTLNYRGVSDSLFSLTESKSYFGDVYGDLAGSSRFSTVLAGGDSGYASRSGFRTVAVDLKDIPFGAPMCLRIELTATQPIDEYGDLLDTEFARAAALVDNLRYVYTPGSRSVPFDRFYSSEAGDYSRLVFDSASGVYTRLFKDGIVQKFNSDGLEISVIDRLENETRYEYTDGDGDGEEDELARIIDPVGLITELTYQNGKLHRITDPANRVTEMTYDANGHLLQILSPDGTTRSFTYDDKGRLLSQTDGQSNQRFYAYQPGSSRLASVTRADGQVYNYTPQQTLGLPAADTGSELEPAALYQSGTLGKNTVSTDARGIQARKALDANGQPTQITDNIGNQINMRYNRNRKLTSVKAANGQEFDFIYDAFGNMTRTVRRYDDAATEVEYDTVLFDLPTQITDPLGRAYVFEYDLQGNLTRTTDPLNQISEFTYNTAGQVLTATDKLGQVSTYTYDTLGRLVSITDELGRTVTYGYDAAGNQTTVTDPQGRVTTTEYDGAGDPIRVIAPDTGITRFVYDGNKNLIQLIDSLGRTKSWTYDERERVTSYTDALGRMTLMTYDEVGNLIAYTREDGTVIEYVYDDVNRVSEVRYPELTGVDADAVFYTYNELYRVTNQSDNDSSIDYAFDPISRLTSTTQTWNGQADTLGFTYDLVDRRISMTDTTGATTYTYDDLDRLIDLTDSANRAFGFAYDELNRLTRKTMANGTATDFTYDKASQLLNIVTKKTSAAEVIERIAYTYNATGTRASETRYNGTVINNRRTFTYDANDRVTQVINMQLPAQDEQFAYDLMGNWATDSRQHNAENELTQDDSGYTYEYDELGNMIVREKPTDPTDRTTYTWDARNLLIAVDGPISETIYAYDARNRRVAKTIDGVTTQYVHDGLNVLLEYDGAGALLARNTHAGLDQLCVRDEVAASTPYYVCQDGISSVLSISNDNGTILQRYHYSAFGEQQVLDANFNPVVDASLIPFAYTGREWEPEVGMYFYRARFYDPALGRFISRDPIGLNGGDVNFYAYVLNNPISYWDPSGLDYVGTIQYQSGALIYGYGTFEGRLYSDLDPTDAIDVSGSLHGIGFQGGYITGEKEIRINADNPNEALGNQGGFFLGDVGIGAGPINIVGFGGSIDAYRGDNNADFGTPDGEVSKPGLSTTFDPTNPGSYVEKPRPGFGFSVGFMGIRVKEATSVESPNNKNQSTNDSSEHN